LAGCEGGLLLQGNGTPIYIGVKGVRLSHLPTVCTVHRVPVLHNDMHSLAAPFQWGGVAGQASTNDNRVTGSFSSCNDMCSQKLAQINQSVRPQPMLGGSTPLGCCTSEIQLQLHHSGELAGPASPCTICSYHQQPMLVSHVSQCHAAVVIGKGAAKGLTCPSVLALLHEHQQHWHECKSAI